MRTPITLLLVVGLLASCSGPPPIDPGEPYWKDADNKPIAEPKFEEPSLAWTAFHRSTFDQLFELFDLDRSVRKLSGRMTQAKNTNSFDEVPNSSWFTNRHGLPQTRMTPEEILIGPNQTDGPDQSGVWKVYAPKVGGATPGFWIEDARGDRYILKFDPPDHPEMATAAGVMGSRFFYACGYNVPQDVIVYWRQENLRIKDGATIKDENGNKRPLLMEDIDEILARVHRGEDGTIRSLASLHVGNVKGPFMYWGTRGSDPNDWCPHQHRRELRGLYVLGSLVNHYDLKDHNSMDVYVGEDSSGYLKHYLSDFASTFGADGSHVKVERKGYANMVDLRDIAVSTVTFGLKQWEWQNQEPWVYPSIGLFESAAFRADKFDPIIPNPAFEQKTNQDTYWGAKIVMAFSDEDLAAIVKSGQLSNPEAEAYLLKTLIERRDKIGRHWFGKVNPLDFPSIESNDGQFQFDFKDLAIEYGLESSGATYQVEVVREGVTVFPVREINATRVVLTDNERKVLNSLFADATSGKADENLLEIKIKTKRKNALKWSEPTCFKLMKSSGVDNYVIVGINHQP